ncbi:hypothetical protein BCV69DRAFT_48069 [Microstroma glucosiphilum]|uniref:Uncharacterized protein n=1 Tax=Pseudomicrostroma glucosiphilum TaxID=1684307 RepID=A0A316U1H7_9BASI|nr:hypothetical protein BCV69DRAFT_48069 [Pseudomicrostroma glucosiphilum]PWN19229.1 hypothetical protein BCV69DRAFT_48069 [Pseudomicrostroma glucosiphilum]
MPPQTRTRSAARAASITEKPSATAASKSKGNGSGKTKGKGKATAQPVEEPEVDEGEDESEDDNDDDGEVEGSDEDNERDGESDENDEEEDVDDEHLEQDDSESDVDEASDKAASEPSASRPPPPLPTSQGPTASSSSSSSARLDPALFKAYFSSNAASTSNLKSSLKKTAPLAPPTQAELREAREQRKAIKVAKRRREERRGGVVKGRDGLPMRRLGDGRTVVRSLDPAGRRAGAGAGAHHEAAAKGLQELPKELYLPISSARGGAEEGDLTNALAAQKSKRFLKRKLGTGSSPLTPTSSSSSATTLEKQKKAATSADDPLGLEDPAFLPGGEFAHLASLTGKKKKRGRGGSGGGGGAVKKPASKSDLRGDAVRGLPGRMGGAAMVFNRSAR